MPPNTNELEFPYNATLCMALQAKSSLNPMSFISTKYKTSVKLGGGGGLPDRDARDLHQYTRLIDSLLVYIMFENVSPIYAYLCRRKNAKS